ncbi:MAG: hypothetical protein Q8M76_05220 [Spirochaetaceae bacterium]|nr:hypothetical protein [Spirochaetaceae bacterium]
MKKLTALIVELPETVFLLNERIVNSFKHGQAKSGSPENCDALSPSGRSGYNFRILFPRSRHGLQKIGL